MSRAGRPLRFLALTIGGWATARAFMLWPPPPTTTANATPAMALAFAGSIDPVRWPAVPIGARRQDRMVATPRRRASPPPSRVPAAGGVTVALAMAAIVHHGDPAAPGAFRPDGAIPAPLLARGRSRLASSAWLIARGGGSGTLTGGQLGASQAGARLTYALDQARRIALSARVATPLRGRGREAAVGLDWQPTRLPLHVLLERRIALDGGQGGPTLLLVGGLPPTSIGAGFRLESYAQAGAIERSYAIEAFGDGAARLTRPIGAIGQMRIDLGAGAWGAAQRGTQRLDIGPTVGAVMPLGTAAMRLTVDWRTRVAGGARPGSGPALSIGTDF